MNEKKEVKHKIYGVVPEFEERLNEVIDNIVRKLNACHYLSNTLQGIDFELFEKATAKLKESAHQDIEDLGMTAVG